MMQYDLHAILTISSLGGGGGGKKEIELGWVIQKSSAGLLMKTNKCDENAKYRNDKRVLRFNLQER